MDFSSLEVSLSSPVSLILLYFNLYTTYYICISIFVFKLQVFVYFSSDYYYDHLSETYFGERLRSLWLRTLIFIMLSLIAGQVFNV